MFSRGIVRSRSITRSLGLTLWGALVGISLWGAAPAGFAEEAPSDQVEFNRDIRPLLTAHCTECHGGVKQLGGVSFVWPEQVLPPEGWVIEPGDPDASVLYERIASTDPDVRMPPVDHGPALSADQIELVRKWIEQGAKWQKHWSFERPVREELPRVKSEKWERSTLDRYVLARLEREGIEPAPDATPAEWLRRVTFDLTGLPPTPEAIDSFCDDVSKHGEAAYAAMVDRLLESPHYGEHWASVWFDQIRYADSKGLGFDNRRNIWKYRDWVIDALNQDLPFDQFTIKQMAGDLLPNPTMEDLVATAAHRLTQANDEGGTDDEEFRIEAVLDRVSTTWQTWQGVTFACAQCHDHPYDPVRHEEYYQFVAFFNNTRDCDIGEEYPLLDVPIKREDYARARELDRQIEGHERAAWQMEQELVTQSRMWQPITRMEASSDNPTRLEVTTTPDGVAEYATVGTVKERATFTLLAEIPEGAREITAVRLIISPHDPAKALSDAEWGFVLSHVAARFVDGRGKTLAPLEFAYVMGDEFRPFLDPQQSLNPEGNTGFGAYTKFNHPRTVAFVLKQPLEIPAGAKLEIKLANKMFIVASFDLTARRGQVAISGDHAFTNLIASAEHRRHLAAARQLREERNQIPSTRTPILEELPPEFRRPTHVFGRGSFITKEQQVEAGLPKAFADMPQKELNRLDLAEWLVSDENPLTSRVTVNRIWARLFGIGIVSTEEDFGSSGELPSDQGLLDHLALRFQHDLGWSQKALIRELVLSRTYRQSNRIRPELLERDPYNRLLARGPRVRLPAEAIRDQALVVSGMLNPQLYGPPVFPPLPSGVWNPFAGGDNWKTAKPGDPNRYRRAIYTYTKRSIPTPMAAAFDAPTRETCAPRRLRSNTPLQALITLNDETMTEFAEGLARQMAAQEGDLRDQIAYGFLAVTSREPRADEISDIVAFYENLPATKTPEQRLALVASALLNHDEAFNK
jgi:hypothetical protein